MNCFRCKAETMNPTYIFGYKVCGNCLKIFEEKKESHQKEFLNWIQSVFLTVQEKQNEYTEEEFIEIPDRN